MWTLCPTTVMPLVFSDIASFWRHLVFPLGTNNVCCIYDICQSLYFLQRFLEQLAKAQHTRPVEEVLVPCDRTKPYIRSNRGPNFLIAKAEKWLDTCPTPHMCVTCDLLTAGSGSRGTGRGDQRNVDDENWLQAEWLGNIEGMTFIVCDWMSVCGR